MEINLNKSSWHYQLATAYGSLHKNETVTDICYYTRQVIKGVFLAVFITCLISVAAFCVIDMFMGIGFSIAYGAMLMNTPGLVVLILIFSIGALCALALASDKVSKSNRNKEPGFVRTAYRSWKDKFCVKVKLV